MEYRVLLLEDEEETLRMLQGIVELIFMRYYPKLSYEILTAQDGKKGLKLYEKYLPNLIVTDIMMPKMDGVRFIQEVREGDTLTPIIAVTALTNEDEIKKIMLAGANTYISKPLNRYIFTGQIRSFVDSFLRKFFIYNKNAINLFDAQVLKRKVEFYIDDEEDLAEFWRFLETKGYDALAKSAGVRTLLEMEKEMLKQGLQNFIVLEEGLENAYLTIVGKRNMTQERLWKIATHFGLDERSMKIEDLFVSFRVGSGESLAEDFLPTPGYFAEVEDAAYYLKELGKQDRPQSAAEFLKVTEKVYNEAISSLFIHLEKAQLALEKFRDPQNEEYMQSFDEIAKELRGIQSALAQMRRFHLLRGVLGIVLEFMSDNDDRMRDLKTRLLFAKTIYLLLTDLQEWMRALFIERGLSNIYLYNDRLFADAMLIVESLIFGDEDE